MDNIKLRIVVWGLGVCGKRFVDRFINDFSIDAIIEGNLDLVGTEYRGIRIISISEYLKKYRNSYVVITPMRHDDIKSILSQNECKLYFLYLDCPSEMQGVQNGMAYLNNKIEQIEGCSKIGLRGMNLWSIYVYYRLKKHGNVNVEILCKEYGELEKKLIADGLSIALERKNDNEFDLILNCQYPQSDVDDTRVNEKDFFDFSRTIEEYYSPRISLFHNKFEGERCFILGNGPSLTISDLELLKNKNEYSMAVNCIYKIFDKTAWRPDFYVADDWRHISGKEQLIESLDVKYKLVSDTDVSFWNIVRPDNIYKYHSNWSCFENGLPFFSKDAAQGVYACGTSIYTCIQIAFFLGFKEVFLLGVDFDYSCNEEKKTNHFVKDYYKDIPQEGVAFFDKEGERAFKVAKKYADEHGLHIYNATRGGKLEIFERVDLDRLLEE